MTVKGNDIWPSENLKLLGVILDRRLNFSHVKEVFMKVSQKIDMLII